MMSMQEYHAEQDRLYQEAQKAKPEVKTLDSDSRKLVQLALEAMQQDRGYHTTRDKYTKEHYEEKESPNRRHRPEKSEYDHLYRRNVLTAKDKALLTFYKNSVAFVNAQEVIDGASEPLKESDGLLDYMLTMGNAYDAPAEAMAPALEFLTLSHHKHEGYFHLSDSNEPTVFYLLGEVKPNEPVNIDHSSNYLAIAVSMDTARALFNQTFAGTARDKLMALVGIVNAANKVFPLASAADVDVDQTTVSLRWGIASIRWGSGPYEHGAYFQADPKDRVSIRTTDHEAFAVLPSYRLRALRKEHDIITIGDFESLLKKHAPTALSVVENIKAHYEWLALTQDLVYTKAEIMSNGPAGLISHDRLMGMLAHAIDAEDLKGRKLHLVPRVKQNMCFGGGFDLIAIPE